MEAAFAVALVAARVLDPIPWLALAGILLGLFLFFRGFPLLQRKRLIQSVPFSTIRGAAAGLVEISGRAIGPYSIVAPLSEMDCYFYRAKILGVGSFDRSAKEETLCVPFFLDDGTGRILVDPRGAESELPLTCCEEVTNSVSDQVRHFLGRHGISPGAPVRIDEYSIRDGDHLFIMGTVQENPEVDPTSQSAGHQTPNYVSHDAADLQREMAFPELGPLPHNPASAEKDQQFDLRPAILLRKGRKGEPFILSSRSQRDLVVGLAVQSSLCIWGGAALTLVSLWALLTRTASIGG